MLKAVVWIAGVVLCIAWWAGVLWLFRGLS